MERCQDKEQKSERVKVASRHSAAGKEGLPIVTTRWPFILLSFQIRQPSLVDSALEKNLLKQLPATVPTDSNSDHLFDSSVWHESMKALLEDEKTIMVHAICGVCAVPAMTCATSLRSTGIIRGS